jgi:hypothetical protein
MRILFVFHSLVFSTIILSPTLRRILYSLSLGISFEKPVHVKSNHILATLLAPIKLAQ